MFELSILETILFVGFFVIERLSPARKFPIAGQWYLHWAVIITFSSVWLVGLLAFWNEIAPFWEPLKDLSLPVQALIGYATYSFVAYWYHRARHSIPVLWRYIHYMHHAPAHMDTRVAFWRHPLEILLDSTVIIIVGKCLGLSMEAVFAVLVIESLLEIFHHSNVHTPLRLRWIGYFVQLPEQHLIHHQRGVHRWNYATITFWDTLFGTVRVPAEWNGRLGVPCWSDTRKQLLYRY